MVAQNSLGFPLDLIRHLVPVYSLLVYKFLANVSCLFNLFHQLAAPSHLQMHEPVLVLKTI